MRRHVVGLVSIAVGTLGVFLGACSSNSGSGTASTSSDFLDQYCNIYAGCCGAEGYPSDGKQCKTFLSLEASGTYNAQAGNTCLSTLQSISQKDPTWCVDDTADADKACNGVYGNGTSGAVQPGGTCASDTDCAAAPTGDTVSCRDYFGSSGATTRICQVWAPGKAGDACGGTQTATPSGTETSFVGSEDSDGGAFPSQITICNTSDGVTCTGNESTGYTCTALGQPGDSCESTGSCVPTAYCDFGGTNNCIARVADGQACTNAQS
ncbi:MAG: hypothetical protein ACREJX_17580, partial [Polyangiaceae bacterium]